MRPPTWAVLAGAVLIILGATLGIEVVHYRGLQHKEAEIVLARVDSLAQHLMAVQKRAEADQAISPALHGQVTDLVWQTRAAIQSLEDANLSDGQIRQIREAFELYNAEVHHMYDLLLAGKVPEAGIRSQGSVDPLHAAYTRAVADTAEVQRQAGLRAYMLSVAGSVGLMLTGSCVGFLVFRRYLVARHQADFLAAEQRALLQSERRIHSLLSNSLDVVVILDLEGQVRYMSPAARQVMGYIPEEWLGRSCFDVIHPDDHATAMATFAEIVASPGRNVTTTLRAAHADQSWRYVELVANNLQADPAVAGIVVTYRDVTRRQAAEAQLAQLAFYDALTGLPNRTRFEERLTQALGAAGRPGLLAVMFLDLDNFKVINDSLGHSIGDQLLVSAAERLRASIRAHDMAARLGGDEFTILLENLTSQDEAQLVARRVQANLSLPFCLEGREVVTTASIGIAFNLANGMQAGDLLRNADVAMYQAKRNGRARQVVYTADMTDEARERLELESDLRRALERGELRLHFQPCVDLQTGSMDEAEALLRWQHPTRGLLAPGLFIPLAEETGLIHEVGRWALEEACRQARSWQTIHPAEQPLTVSVNLSARQIQSEALSAEVASVLRRTRLDPRLLKLELTESVMMGDADLAARTLGDLKSLGVKLAVDDFGRGYSSLAYLKRFPIDVLKIDRSFVERMEDGPEDRAIVRAIITLAETLNLQVTAEGIETEAQCLLLRELGCAHGQGFYFARPMPPEQITERLAAQVRRG